MADAKVVGIGGVFLEDCEVAEELVFTADEVLERVDSAGDLFGS